MGCSGWRRRSNAAGGTRVGRDDVAERVDEVEPQHVRRVEHERIGSPATDRIGELRERALEHPGGLEESPRPDAALAEEREQPRRRAPVPRRLVEVDLAEPVEQARRRRRLADQAGRVEHDDERVLVGVGSRRARPHHDHVEPSTGRGWARRDAEGGGRAAICNRDRSSDGRDQRGAEHDRDDRRVEVGVEHALGKTDAGEDQSDLASGEHPEPDEQPVADAAEETEPGGDLADAGDDDAARR